jgi:CBS domain-containing protein
MKVREVMTRQPQCCDPATNLASAAAMMWSNDCGVLPVVENDKLSGIITDRDICIALGTRNRAAAETPVREVATRDVQVCRGDDDVSAAMSIMRRAQVRRLPVVGASGKLEGIVTLNDLVLACGYAREQIDSEDFVQTLKGVCQHRLRAIA